MAFEITDELEVILDTHYNSNSSSGVGEFVREACHLCNSFILTNQNLFPNLNISQLDIEESIKDYYLL